MFDYLLTENTDANPTWLAVTISLLSAFVLSFLLVVTYQITDRGYARPRHFMQAIGLVSVVAAMVMQAIGDSIARGLGILGALSVIRFRTRLDDPRNMAFIFASLGVGIASGVFGFTVALVGTLIFCGVALLMHFSPLSQNQPLVGNLRVRTLPDLPFHQSSADLFNRFCKTVRLQEERLVEEPASAEGSPDGERLLRQLTYVVVLKGGMDAADFYRAVQSIAEVEEVRLRFNPPSIRL